MGTSGVTGGPSSSSSGGAGVKNGSGAGRARGNGGGGVSPSPNAYSFSLMTKAVASLHLLAGTSGYGDKKEGEGEDSPHLLECGQSVSFLLPPSPGIYPPIPSSVSGEIVALYRSSGVALLHLQSLPSPPLFHFLTSLCPHSLPPTSSLPPSLDPHRLVYVHTDSLTPLPPFSSPLSFDSWKEQRGRKGFGRREIAPTLPFLYTQSSRLLPPLAKILEEGAGKSLFIDSLRILSLRIVSRLLSSPPGCRAILPHLSLFRSILSHPLPPRPENAASSISLSSSVIDALEASSSFLRLRLQQTLFPSSSSPSKSPYSFPFSPSPSSPRRRNRTSSFPPFDPSLPSPSLPPVPSPFVPSTSSSHSSLRPLLSSREISGGGGASRGGNDGIGGLTRSNGGEGGDGEDGKENEERDEGGMGIGGGGDGEGEAGMGPEYERSMSTEAGGAMMERKVSVGLGRGVRIEAVKVGMFVRISNGTPC